MHMKKVALGLLLGGVLCGCAFSATEGGRRPNLLFIYTDDQRYDALSVVQREQGDKARFPWLKTPNMDRLADEGVRFRNAFVVNSLCAPSRAVNLTGRYSHFNGIASNFRPFPTNSVTHATLLRAAGYTTAYVGKWHMDSQRERPGFDHHASFIGHARYKDADFIVDGADTPTKGWIDDVSTDYAVSFIRKQKGGAKPWSLVLGYKTPHGPCEPPERATARFADAQARAVPNLKTPVPYLGGVSTRAVAADTEAATVPVNLGYFRCLSAVDECVGRLLDALDETGFASNTVVIYTSDNGFYLGEHGLGDKRSAYEESLRVPFLVRDPALGAAGRGRVADEMVLNLDLAQTLLDYAGVPAPDTMQGRSWRPLLTGKADGWRSSWFYEYFAENQKNSRVPDITAVRTADAKLIVYAGHPEWSEVFDVKGDPYETKNLFADPAQAALRASLEAEHARLAKEVGYCVPDYTDRPDWWGKPGGPDWKPLNAVELRLHYDGQALEGARVPDRSGQGNHGHAQGVTVVDGREGRKALRFSGEGSIDVPKAKSLDPSKQGWTVEATVKGEQPQGVILARGGKTAGYALWLKGGCPAFSVKVGSKPVTVVAKQPLAGWATVAGVISVDHKAQLYVDGKLAGAAPLEDFFERDPNDAMQVGADLGSPVLDPLPPKFVGLIESVRVSSGDALGGKGRQTLIGGQK
jgi:arylsulfatase A-like enzyme